MFTLLALVLLVGGVILAAVMMVVGRWAAALPFGVRSFRQATKAPIGRGAPTTALALARAGGGVLGWYLTSSLLVGFALLVGGQGQIDEESMRVHVGAGGPAARAGIQDGDRVLTLDGAPVRDWDGLKRAVASHASETVRVEVERGGQTLTFEPTPEGTPARIMVGPEFHRTQVGFGSALASGLVEPAKVTIAMARGFARAIGGSDKPEMVGPVGVVKETESAQRRGTADAVHLVALLLAYLLPWVAIISVALAFVARRRETPPPT